MVRVEITEIAYEALLGSLPAGLSARAPQRSDTGIYLWLTHTLRNRLMAQRQRGEDLSDTIMRLGRTEGKAAP